MFTLILQLTELFKETVILLRQTVALLTTISRVILIVSRRRMGANLMDQLLAELVETKNACLQFFEKQGMAQVPPDPLHDAKYAATRIGVGNKTIGRLTKRGMLPVDSYLNHKRLFRESDIEKCRRFYRGE